MVLSSGRNGVQEEVPVVVEVHEVEEVQKEEAPGPSYPGFGFRPRRGCLSWLDVRQTWDSGTGKAGLPYTLYPIPYTHDPAAMKGFFFLSRSLMPEARHPREAPAAWPGARIRCGRPAPARSVPAGILFPGARARQGRGFTP